MRTAPGLGAEERQGPTAERAGLRVTGGWPACLTQFSDPKGVRFTGAVVWGGGSVGQAEVLWVDCSGR